MFNASITHDEYVNRKKSNFYIIWWELRTLDIDNDGANRFDKNS